MTITKQESLCMRGICITLIVLHNMLHYLTEVKENEFTFVQEKLDMFISFASSSPICSTISYLGWLGVSGFVFLSGYGLTSKYESRIESKTYLFRHFTKLFILLLPAFLCFLVYEFFNYEFHLIDYLYFILEQFLVLNILNPEAIQPGVFWYLGLAFQLYLCFIILRKATNTQLLLFAAICVTVCIGLPSTTEYFRHNSIGWMPEFIFGILLARTKGRFFKPTLYIALFLGGLFATAISALSRFTFLFSGIAFVTVLLAARNPLSKSRFLSIAGFYSASIYIVHPIIRIPWPQTRLLSQLDPIFDAAFFLFISVFVAYFYNKIYITLNTKAQLLCPRAN